MKISIPALTVLLILSSCATTNYGRIKYSRVNSQLTQEVASIQHTENNDETSYVNEEELDDIEHVVSPEKVNNTLENIQQETQNNSKKSKKYTSLRDKLNRIQQDQLKEINAIHNQNKDTISEEKQKDPTRVERRARLFGWLSFIPIPVIGWIFSILAITYGAIALNRLKKGTYVGNYNKATTGLFLGILTLVVWIIIILLFMASI